MPSVDVVWKGRCIDRQVQQELCEHLLQLSEISNRKFNAYFGGQVHAVFFNPPEGESKYLISSRVFGNEVLPAKIKKVDDGIFIGEGLSLYGVEIPLFDPRNNTPPFGLGASNRISFVFIRNEDPAYDGRLVQACPVSERNRLNTISQTVLVNPGLTLRYYLENWMGQLLGWVKHFYIPDLYYWIWRDYPGYEAYRGKVSKHHGMAKQYFDPLVEAFSEEADLFTEEIEGYLREREAQGKGIAIKLEGEKR